MILKWKFFIQPACGVWWKVHWTESKTGIQILALLWTRGVILGNSFMCSYLSWRNDKTDSKPDFCTEQSLRLRCYTCWRCLTSPPTHVCLNPLLRAWPWDQTRTSGRLWNVVWLYAWRKRTWILLDSNDPCTK